MDSVRVCDKLSLALSIIDLCKMDENGEWEDWRVFSSGRIGHLEG